MTSTTPPAPRGLDDIAEALRAAKDRGGKCTVLIGAGCSCTAGIPLSSGIVDDIRKHHPHAYKCAQKRRPAPGYGECMRELSPGVRRDLLKGYIDKSRINWAHIGVAQLVKHGYLDRLLTTNFDSLIARGCALVNEFPAVYDLTASTLLRPADLPDRAVFHLHGQRNGFVLLNESEELEKHAKQLKPLFEHARDGRVWIVAGYSGENDPLFRLIRDAERYEYDLFWIDINPEAPPALAEFFSHERRCFHVHYPRGADIFFMALAHALGAWPPVFLDNPFAHVRQQLAGIVEKGEDGTDQGIDWLKQARDKVDAAEAAVQPPGDDMGAVQSAYLEGGGEQAVAVSQDAGLKAGLLVNSGNELAERANALAPIDLAAACDLWRQAGERYAQALDIKPDAQWAANNWGSALALEASALADINLVVAREIWHKAGERYAQALAINPGNSQVAYNWGITLDNEAQAIADGDLPAARELWRQAGERYAQALAIKPDLHNVADNWGIALLHSYHYADIADQALMLDQAERLLLQAEAIKTGSGAYNLACVYGLRQDATACVAWLRNAQAADKLNVEHIAKDIDLDPVRETPEFQAFLAELGGESPT